jgi:SAM-dependent methyltransferase
MASPPQKLFDKVNLRTYSARRVVRQSRKATGWLDAGEEAAFRFVAEFAKDKAILDIGVGGGRTAPLMLWLSQDYCGIDYCPTMVDVARSRFQHLRFLHMDARSLTFEDHSFDLVTFSYNGIDSVDLQGRMEILRSVHRVLRPNGYFVFSALNRQGTAHDDRWPDLRAFWTAGLSMNRQARAVGHLLLGGANWVRLRPHAVRGEDVAVGNLSAHDFGLITLFTSVPAQVRQLTETGFQTEAIFDPDGRSIPPDGHEATAAPWCHFVARRPFSAL